MFMYSYISEKVTITNVKNGTLAEIEYYLFVFTVL